MAMASEVHFQDQGPSNGAYHFKILVPSVAAGAIIGKGGENIAQLQKEAGARVNMSKAKDFYPGTTERICLITGSVDGILRILDFIMGKIKEKPDPKAKMAIDFDHRQPAEREKQVKILVPNSTAGMIIGKGGSYIKQIKEESGAYVQISQTSKGHALAERCITVIGEMENNKTACCMILAKIVEDPKSGTCFNVSYADVTGPVANFDPTGSPFANPGSIPCGAMNNSNTNYGSNQSLNSLPSNVTNFNCAQVIENIKSTLRGNGFSEQAMSEISSAMNTLASYGILGPGLGSLNGGTPVLSGSAVTNCPVGGITNQGMYTSATGLEAACNLLATSGPGSNMFTQIDSFGNGMSGPAFNSPSTSRSNDDFLYGSNIAEAAMFRPFRSTSPDLASPSAAALPVNADSFRLGTGLSSGSPSLRESPTRRERPVNAATKIEIEVDENIVGAILGPGGKALVEIQQFSGANIQISKKGIYAPGTRNRIVSISGLPTAVNTAQYLIERQITEEEAQRAQRSWEAVHLQDL